MQQLLRATLLACLLVAGGASFAAAPSEEDALATLQAAYRRAAAPGERADFYADLFASVLRRVQRSYANEVDLAAFTAAAIRTMDALPAGSGEPAHVFNRATNSALASLDPYSRYLDARAWSNQRGDSQGSFGGLGLQVEASEGAVRVVAPVPGTPAARAGLRAGDLILRIDETSLQGVPLGEAIARMRGEPGTPVSLTIRRTGSGEEITVSLTRDTIRQQPLRWSMEGDVLVVRVASFMGPVTAALQEAVAAATATQAPRAVVLDLRGNPGGLLREAVTLADAFLTQGEIVSLRGRTPANQRSWHADANELLPGVPMVVLVDRRSASASELVSAALQDHGRATVMGQRSFGKGTVQSTMTLGEEAKGALKLTTAIYVGPSGRSVQKVGVTPDIEVGTADAKVDPGRCGAIYKAADPVLSCAVAFLLSADRNAFLTQVSISER